MNEFAPYPMVSHGGLIPDTLQPHDRPPPGTVGHEIHNRGTRPWRMHLMDADCLIQSPHGDSWFFNE